MRIKSANETGQSELPGRAALAGVLKINGLNGAFKSFGELHNKSCGALQYVGALAYSLDGLQELPPLF